MPDSPMLVFGPRSLDYDFGPAHPLTPRRFGPGIGLLRHLGAEPSLAPEPASDAELRMSHTPGYLDVVKRFSEFDHGWMEPEAGIGVGGDDPPFPGMHEAAAAVAGGSIRAVEAILRGDVARAFHPGGGLHHAMPSRASGFCIYNDVALAIARARADGLRVLYIDLDVHHGDGVEAIHRGDPGVMTFSIHETPRYLFPYETGFADEIGSGTAAGSAINVPLEPDTGEKAWLGAVEALVPPLAAAFGPDLIVSQHGADSHAWDPLAHLRNTTTAMAGAARLVAGLAARRTGGRWLATGGGGYRAYDVVPRTWAAVWLAMTGADAPDRLPEAWREEWAEEAARYGVTAMPATLDDAPNLGDPSRDRRLDGADSGSAAVAGSVASVVLPALIRAATSRRWWSPLGDEGVATRAPSSVGDDPARLEPTVVEVDRGTWDRLRLAPRVVMPADTAEAHALIGAALAADVTVTAAVIDDVVVGVVVSAPTAARAAAGRADAAGPDELLAIGVAPAHRRRGLATALLRAHVARLGSRPVEALVTVAERDPVEPLDRAVRRQIAERLLVAAGFDLRDAPEPVRRLDPDAVLGRRTA